MHELRTIMMRLSFFTLLLCFSFSSANTLIAVIGDYGSGSSSEAQVAHLVKSHQPESIITVGDNNYPMGCQETIDEHIGQFYSAYIGHYEGKYGSGSPTNHFFPSLGNHDWYAIDYCPEKGTLPYLNYFSLPHNGRYYVAHFDLIDFFIIDSDEHEEDGRTIGSKQYQWIFNQARQSKALYKVAVMHHPPYSSSWHGSTADMQWDFKNMGIQLILSGHDHIYERIQYNELTYIVNGLGGTDEIYQASDKVPGSQIIYNQGFGALFLNASPQQLDISFVNLQGQLIDTKVIKNNL